ncbi:MAG TPA: GTPase ObgE [Longimicrobiales bacterium]|nr:GTPase ObgE [Longimicrobiales bacterium]
MFIDRAVIEVRGGPGGAGAEAFRREKGVPRGGPSGGDGGKGGDVVLVGDGQLSTLLDYSYRTRYHAERGQHGEGSNRTGRSGEDLVLRVPLGTSAYDADTAELLGELLEEGQRLVVAEGGRGGRGNTRFKTSTHQAPREWESGQEGTERRIRLELKLIADVGLVGEPNAGKSTLLASVTAARPKIADYPFTTLEPNLGVVQLSGFRSFVLADLPGIIEGAHEGKGLGHQFLRHIERTRVLLVLTPVDAGDPQGEVDRLRSELAAYSEQLASLPFLVGISKVDLLPPGERAPELAVPAALGVLAFSSVSGSGIPELLERLWEASRAATARERAGEEDEEW